MSFDITNFDKAKYDEVLSRGLSYGLGNRDGKMCIEAALCTALGLPHGDNPGCVAISVRSFKIRLNDSYWSSDKARSKGMYKLGIAQLGSLGVVGDIEFAKLVSEKTIRRIIPKLLRELVKTPEALTAANNCENGENISAAAVHAAAANAANAADDYLIISAELALETLRELHSPGVQLLDGVRV